MENKDMKEAVNKAFGIQPPQPKWNTYYGARYVPEFADPVEWSSSVTYEPLTIVTWQGNSYTSRQYVPVGVDISNEDFWALTGNYNAQVEAYRKEVEKIKDDLLNFENNQTDINNNLKYSIENPPVTNIRTVTANDRYNGWPSIAQFGNLIVVAYTSAVQHYGAVSQRHTMIKYSDNSGQSWSAEIQLDDTNGMVGGLVVAGNLIYCTSMSNINGIEIYSSADAVNWRRLNNMPNPAAYKYFVAQNPSLNKNNELFMAVDAKSDVSSANGNLVLVKYNILTNTFSYNNIRENIVTANLWEARSLYHNNYYILLCRNNSGYFNFAYSKDNINWEIVPSNIRTTANTPITGIIYQNMLVLNWYSRTSYQFGYAVVPLSSITTSSIVPINPILYSYSQGLNTTFNCGYNQMINYKSELISVFYSAPTPLYTDQEQKPSNIYTMYVSLQTLLNDLSINPNLLTPGGAFELYTGLKNNTVCDNIGGFTFVSDNNINVIRSVATGGLGGYRVEITPTIQNQTFYIVQPIRGENKLVSINLQFDCSTPCIIRPVTDGDINHEPDEIQYNLGLYSIPTRMTGAVTMIGLKITLTSMAKFKLLNYNVAEQYFLNDLISSYLPYTEYRVINTHIAYNYPNFSNTNTTYYLSGNFINKIESETGTLIATPIKQDGTELPDVNLNYNITSSGIVIILNKLTNDGIIGYRIKYFIYLNNLKTVDISLLK